MNAGLKYKKHIIKTVSKDLMTAITLKRLKLIFSSTTKQLFEATIAPILNYTLNI